MDGIRMDDSAKVMAQRWLGDFAAALASGDAERLAPLFAAECHWRDILAFTWNLHTTSGARAIAQRLAPLVAQVAPRALQLAPGRAPRGR